MTTTYTGPQKELFHDALRTVVGAAKARVKNDGAEVSALYSGYLDDAQRLGVAMSEAWAILSVAGVIWMSRLIETRAADRGVSVDDVVSAMAESTLKAIVVDGG